MAVEQALRPGYSDFSNTISDLGVGAYSGIFNTSVMLLGIIAFVGILVLVRIFPAKPLTYVGEILLLVGVLGAVGVGLFPEPSPALGGNAHDFFSIVTFLDANVGFLIIGITMYGDKIWDRYANITTVLGAISTVALAFYVYFFLGNGWYFGIGMGGLERIVAFPVMIWAIWIGLTVLTCRVINLRS
jgi:hypothetical membrane protein